MDVYLRMDKLDQGGHIRWLGINNRKESFSAVWEHFGHAYSNRNTSRSRSVFSKFTIKPLRIFSIKNKILPSAKKLNRVSTSKTSLKKSLIDLKISNNYYKMAYIIEQSKKQKLIKLHHDLILFSKFKSHTNNHWIGV